VRSPTVTGRKIYVGVNDGCPGRSASWTRSGSTTARTTTGRHRSSSSRVSCDLLAFDYVESGGVVVVSGALPGDQLLPSGSSASVSGFKAPEGGRVWAPALATLFGGTGTGEVRLHEDRVVKY